MAIQIIANRARNVLGTAKDAVSDVQDRAKTLAVGEHATPSITAIPSEPIALPDVMEERPKYGMDKASDAVTGVVGGIVHRLDNGAPEAPATPIQNVQVVKPVAKPAQGIVTVTTQATLIRPARTSRNQVDIANIGPVAIYIAYEKGVSTPTTGGNGHYIPAGGSHNEQYWAGEIWGVCEEGEAVVSYLEV